MLLIICFRNRLHLKSTDMKLLYITNGVTGSGGLERVLSVKASVLAEEFGYEVHLLSLNEIGKDTFFDFSEKVRKVTKKSSVIEEYFCSNIFNNEKSHRFSKLDFQLDFLIFL